MWQVCIAAFVCTVDNIVVRLITLVNYFAMFIFPSFMAAAVIMCSKQRKELVSIWLFCLSEWFSDSLCVSPMTRFSLSVILYGQAQFSAMHRVADPQTSFQIYVS